MSRCAIEKFRKEEQCERPASTGSLFCLKHRCAGNAETTGKRCGSAAASGSAYCLNQSHGYDMTSIETPYRAMSEDEIDRQIKKLELDRRVEEVKQLRDKAKLSWITPAVVLALLPVIGGLLLWGYSELKQYSEGFQALTERDKLKQEKLELERYKNSLNIEISTLVDLKNHYEKEASRLLLEQSKLKEDNIALSVDRETLQQQNDEMLKRQKELRKEYEELAELLKKVIETPGLPKNQRVRFVQEIRLASLKIETINRIIKQESLPHTTNIVSSSETLEGIKKAYRQIVNERIIITIPIVIHIVYRTEEENISDEQIQSQLRVINEDFRARNSDLSEVPEPFKDHIGDAHIEFVLANRDPAGNIFSGVIRTRTTFDSFGNDDSVKSSLSGGSNAWQPDKYLNIWVCALRGGTIVYAQFPGSNDATDGIVINYETFGTTGTASAPPFNKGRSLTVGVAKYLGLHNIWGNNINDCTGSSDFVADTPNQGGPNFGKPAFPRISCDNGPHGDMFMNFLDYVDDDSMYMFTKGQVVRMHDTLNGPRKSLGSKRFKIAAEM